MNIEPHIELPGWKNPELSIGGVKADIKAVEGYKGIRWGLVASKRQGAKITVFNLDKIKNLDPASIARELSGKITETRGKTVEGVYFVYKNRVVYLSRETIVKGDYSALKTLKGGK